MHTCKICSHLPFIGEFLLTKSSHFMQIRHFVLCGLQVITVRASLYYQSFTIHFL